MDLEEVPASGPFGGKATAPSIKLLLTVDEACAALSLSRTCLYGLLAAGEVASIKVGGRRRIPYSALGEFVARACAKQREG
jgi:excisionase family DNA binding protein